MSKTATRGIATLVIAAMVVFSFGMIQEDDDETGRRAVHFAATWSEKRRAAIEYGVITARIGDRHTGIHWDADLLAKPGDKVVLRVSFHGMSTPDRLKCWITVNDNVYDSQDPDQSHGDGSCEVVAVVR